MKKLGYFLVCLSALMSCNKDTDSPGVDSDVVESDLGLVNPNLKYFGFTLVDVFFDDPTDTDTKTNYIDEVHSFSNVADILVYDPSQDIALNTAAMLNLDVKPYLHLNEIFFEQTSTGGSMSGVTYSLRSDYQQRWDTFLSTNPFITNLDSMQCFYIGEEPTWNGISFDDLKLACDYAKQTAPDIPILVIEAYPVLDQLQLPTSVDWYGFDHYFIENPVSSEMFSADLETIRSKQSSPNQKLMLIMDAHYISFGHGLYGIEQTDLTSIANQYFYIANTNNDVVGILGYHWPSGFEYVEAIGARHLSAATKNRYIEIGKTITGK